MLHRPTTKKNSVPAPSKASLPNPESGSEFSQISPILRKIKYLTDRGDYSRALDVLSKSSHNPEELNCRGVCLLRLHKFAEAIGPFRMATLDFGTMQLREQIATHIKVNFAIALFFGGIPHGGLRTLSESQVADDDPGATMLRKQARLWVESMSPLQRLFWKIGFESSVKPLPPEYPVGQFVWDLKVTE